MPEESKTSKAQQKAVQKYVKANYDRVVVTLPKGRREVIKEYASKCGESMNAFIVRAVNQAMEQATHGPDQNTSEPEQATPNP